MDRTIPCIRTGKTRNKTCTNKEIVHTGELQVTKLPVVAKASLLNL